MYNTRIDRYTTSEFYRNTRPGFYGYNMPGLEGGCVADFDEPTKSEFSLRYCRISLKMYAKSTSVSARI